MASKPPEQMDRDELEETVRALRARLDDLESQIAGVRRSAATESAVNLLIKKLTNADVDMAADPGQNLDAVKDIGERLNSIENTVQRHESEIQQGGAGSNGGSGDHWPNVVEAAQNLRSDHRHHITDEWVILYKEDIRTATGLSTRRAGQLIDEWTDEECDKHKAGTRKQDYRPPSADSKGNAQKKALKVDLEVWGDE